MTEAEWLTCEDPLKMLHHLRTCHADRKALLLCCGCIRRHWGLISVDGRSWVLLAEDSAEQRKSQSDLFGDDWDGVMTVAGEHMRSWDGVSGAIGQLWCAYYELADYDTLTGNQEWAAERREQVTLLRDIFGNPFRPVSIDPAGQTPTVLSLAQAAYENRILPAGSLQSDRLAILADALEEAGCDNADILNHLRQPGEHVRGCWAVDLVLGKV